MLETGRGLMFPVSPGIRGGSRLKMDFGTLLSARFAIQYFESCINFPAPQHAN
jgi:hypothetical protein